MSEPRACRVAGVRESLVRLDLGDSVALRNEIACVRLGDEVLKGEILRIQGRTAEMQMFDDTRGIRFGDPVELTGEMLAATLGPGLLGQVYDGLQNPLSLLHERHGQFLQRGVSLPPVDAGAVWEFRPLCRKGDRVSADAPLGTVMEGAIEHPILPPFDMAGDATVDAVHAGPADAATVLVTLRGDDGARRDVRLHRRWPVRRPLGNTLVREGRAERLLPQAPLRTGIRLIDSVFPVALGGTACIPGPFGAGKTVLLNLIARHAEADVVVIVACGERAGEVTETISEFPKLLDPRTGRPLMERTVLICNTSAMPVSARESSIHFGVTIAEYYRQLGKNVLLLADSTSRWAQAMRESSGFMEEIPGDEAFPAYLDSAIKGLYERSGIIRAPGGPAGSLTMIGTVSPAGGNLEEPVTQATLGTVKAFLGLSSERAYRRAYPAIDPLLSWSRYRDQLQAWYDAHLEPGWNARIAALLDLVRAGDDVRQLVRVTGESGISLADYLVLLKANLVDAVFLQQNAMDRVDAAMPLPRQRAMVQLASRVATAEWPVADKEEARVAFVRLTSEWLDLNKSPEGSDAYRAHLTAIEAMLQPVPEGG